MQKGFVNSVSDSSLFVLKTPTVYILLLVYVNDIIITCPNLSYIKDLTFELDSVFSLKDLGDLHFFLGVEVTREAIFLFGS